MRRKRSACRSEEVYGVALPTGWTVRVTGIHASFGADGTNPSCSIAYTLVDGSGNCVAQELRHNLTAEGGDFQRDAFTASGAGKSFTTSVPPYSGASVYVDVAGKRVTTGFTATATSTGTVKVAFSTAPAKGAQVVLSYATGPGLGNAAGDIPAVLGLSSGTGTVYTGTVLGQSAQTSHQSVVSLATVLLGWAQERVMRDKF